MKSKSTHISMSLTSLILVPDVTSHFEHMLKP
jgi:hypothetical protein